MPTAAYYTLGCKVNQYETEQIRREMESRGFDTVSFASPADVYVVNTCTVTAIADGKSRHELRRAVRRNPDALIIATGCYADLDPHALAEIEGVDLVLPNSEKEHLAHQAAVRFPELNGHSRPNPIPRIRTRAILKVQDGCDQFCAYCAVPFARPVKRSRPLDEVLSEAEALAAFGYKEIVLTGIRLGAYEGANGESVAELTRRVCEIDGLARIRLSSIELWEITDELIAAMAGSPKVCPHLHVPLQSGDDGVLAAMGRPYDTRTYAEVISRARELIPDLAVTTDVMVGFPGESDEAFERSLRFVEEMRFSRLHVFRYSPRPRARASGFRGQVSPASKEERSDMMIELGRRLAQDFAEQRVGRTVRVLVERTSGDSRRRTGYTHNYIEVEFDGSTQPGGIVDVRAAEAREGKLIGELSVDS